MMKLRLPPVDKVKAAIPEYLRYHAKDDNKIEPIEKSFKETRRISQLDFEKIVKWILMNMHSCHKEKRMSASSNEEDLNRALKKSISSPCKYEALRILCRDPDSKIAGVGPVTASAILHFLDERDFPILSSRALAAVEYEKKVSNANSTHLRDLWNSYTDMCREFKAKHDLSMRDIDRGLWILGKRP